MSGDPRCRNLSPDGCCIERMPLRAGHENRELLSSCLGDAATLYFRLELLNFGHCGLGMSFGLAEHVSECRSFQIGKG